MHAGTQRRVHIKPTRPAGPGVWFDLIGDDDPREGSAGWQDVSRPRRQSGVEWVGQSASAYVLPLLLDGVEVSPGRDQVIEKDIRAVRSWFVKTKKTGEPPVLAITGPLHFPKSMRWVVADMVWGAKIRDPGGRRVQQALTLTLKQYLEPSVVKSPAKKARHRQGK
ncbi:hypothetical protein [Nocardioides sp.]|uniref:hypothetical protein n=1 Tax=Nocardioides sp. TaxID=35761 RepID=UPI002632C9C2|nr:hypothetical protein [Nocardioides sp.]MDI6911485.1 hypothetical protein [Nocardioides sp.]